MKNLLNTVLLGSVLFGATTSTGFTQPPAALAEDIAKGCEFRIQVKAGKEYVSIGSDGNILRWKKHVGDTDDARRQRWVLHAKNEGYRIASVANGEYMAVGSNGNILRWANDPETQLFGFIDPSGDWVSLREPTGGERVAVGSNGNVLRWRSTGGDEQLFKFEPVDGTCRNAPNAYQRESAEVPDPPLQDSAQSPSTRKTDPVLISTEFMPAAFVDDPSYENLVRQNENVPFYRLERWRYWEIPKEKGAETLIRAKIDQEFEVTVSTFFESSSYSEQRSTVSFKGDYTRTAGGKLTVKAAEISASQTLKASFEKTDETVQGESQNSSTSNTEQNTIKISTTQETLWLTWRLVDEYRLYRGVEDSDRLVWSKPAVVPARLFYDAFPREGNGDIDTVLETENAKLSE